MKTMQGVRAGWFLGAIGACVLAAGVALAEAPTERPGSILIFPKVVSDGTRDTVIQITNTGNMLNLVRCFYLDARSNGCNEIDFDLALTRQQPTMWVTGEGRAWDPTDSWRGLDPGLVPPVAPGFTGALVCVEVNNDLLPVAQNKLKGEATLMSPTGGTSIYNALAVPGSESNDRNNVLRLDGTEYGTCPTTLWANFIPDGGRSPAIEEMGNAGTCAGTSTPCNPNNNTCGAGVACVASPSRVDNVLTVLPCNMDFNTGVRGSSTLQFVSIDEFEQTFSGSRSVSCWGSFDMGEIPALRYLFDPLNPGTGSLYTEYATVRISASSPIAAVMESFQQDSTANSSSAAVNLHTTGPGASSTIRLMDH